MQDKYNIEIFLSPGVFFNALETNRTFHKTICNTDQQKGLKPDCTYNMKYSSRKRVSGIYICIYSYYKIFDKHRCSSPTGSLYVFCINVLK